MVERVVYHYLKEAVSRSYSPTSHGLHPTSRRAFLQSDLEMITPIAKPFTVYRTQYDHSPQAPHSLIVLSGTENAQRRRLWDEQRGIGGVCMDD